MTRPILILASAAAACAGCGRWDTPGRLPVFPAAGVVYYRGAPAAGADILFFPRHNPDPRTGSSGGQVGADGRFTLTTYVTGDGAPAGEFVVVIIWTEPPPPAATAGEVEGDKTGPDKLRGKYGDQTKSPLRRTIPVGGGVIERIDLE